MQVVGPSQIPPYGPSCGSTNHDLWYIGAFDPVRNRANLWWAAHCKLVKSNIYVGSCCYIINMCSEAVSHKGNIYTQRMQNDKHKMIANTFKCLDFTFGEFLVSASRLNTPDDNFPFSANCYHILFMHGHGISQTGYLWDIEPLN